MNQKIKQAFTVIEVIVWVTILSIIMISVMSIYISTNDISLKTDINRSMQENIKNAVETLAEDIRKNDISGVVDNNIDSCTIEQDKNQSGIRLCIWGNIYWLQKKVGDTYMVANNQDCDEVKESWCTLVRNGKPLMNSWVDVKNLEFIVYNWDVPKVTLLMEVQPSIEKWIKPDLIKQNRMDFQTTISQRPDLN